MVVGPSKRRPTRYHALWALALFGGSLLWADLWHVAIYRSDAIEMPVTLRFATALGMVGPLYAGLGILAAIVWAATKKPNAAMWTLTTALLVALAFLSIGGVRMMSAE